MKHIGIIGLGNMGLGYAQRLYARGYKVSGYDHKLDAMTPHDQQVIHIAPDVPTLVTTVDTVLLALPAPAVETVITQILSVPTPKVQLVIDGGNTPYGQAPAHAQQLHARGIAFADMGVSGGIHGKDRGYCLMLGCDIQTLAELEPLCTALACPGGWQRVGPIGTGHYVKMVHNAIEYCILQAYVEGIGLLEVAPSPIDMGALFDLWEHGSLLSSRLLEYVTQAAHQQSAHKSMAIPVSDFVQDLVTYGQDKGLTLDALKIAITMRQATHRGTQTRGTAIIGAARQLFGGHPQDQVT